MRVTERTLRSLWVRTAQFAFTLSCFAFAGSLHADYSSIMTAPEPDWSQNATIPEGGDRANIYQLTPEELTRAKIAGARLMVSYPVNVTGILIPYRPLQNLLEGDENILQWLLGGAASAITGYESMDDMYSKLGLKNYPGQDGEHGFHYPLGTPAGQKPSYRMGASFIDRRGASGLTFSCATCHVGQLFGRPVFGMSNRFSRANEFFVEHQNAFSDVSIALYRIAAGATDAEIAMLRETKDRMKWVGAKHPQQLGLDTSLAQVALSLSKRELDPYAEMTANSAAHPRRNVLETQVADSKPAVWWTLKYKTRWLSDGSILSGNPVHTNFLWNELGRATNLHDLETWLVQNQATVRELTAAVFAAEAPRFTEFFPASRIDLAAAKRGESIFLANCARCHGVYDKAWNAENAPMLTPEQLLETTKVHYRTQTAAIDVGTDPGRRAGMQAFAQRLNDLKISQTIGTVVQPQVGYVPPPLVGIWARWPYFHNSSAPTLCAVLTKGADRPSRYYAGEPENRSTDFDADCNGYPSGNRVPTAWTQDPEKLYDTSREGLSNRGHDEGIFLSGGNEILTPTEKKELITFLQTL